MADLTQNISAQLFVKELPAAQRADFTGCKQDFNSPQFTTCVNDVISDNAVENAFQSQLNLSEYYKSPEVFETLKNSYMSKTMDAHFETEVVNLDPEPQTNQVSSAPINATVGPRDFIQGRIKESFGSAGQTPLWIVIVAIIAILYYFMKKKN